MHTCNDQLRNNTVLGDYKGDFFPLLMHTIAIHSILLFHDSGSFSLRLSFVAIIK